MGNNEWELGYACDIALELLLNLYASNSDFTADWQYVDRLTEPLQTEMFISGGQPEPLFQAFLKYQTYYGRFCNEEQRRWKTFINIAPDNLRAKIEAFAEKWGLRCDWGCGFIISFSPDFHGFILTPGPPDSTLELKTKVDIYNDKEEIKQKFKDLEEKAITFMENTRNNLSALDYRGFEKHQKKDLATQVQWLFWHITPPYLNDAEIAARLQNTTGDIVDPYYIQRCYQNMAKLLGIKLKKGWPKGRKRASQQTRAVLREREIEAKTGLKNDL